MRKIFITLLLSLACLGCAGVNENYAEPKQEPKYAELVSGFTKFSENARTTDVGVSLVAYYSNGEPYNIANSISLRGEVEVASSTNKITSRYLNENDFYKSLKVNEIVTTMYTVIFINNNKEVDLPDLDPDVQALMSLVIPINVYDIDYRLVHFKSNGTVEEITETSVVGGVLFFNTNSLGEFGFVIVSDVVETQMKAGHIVLIVVGSLIALAIIAFIVLAISRHCFVVIDNKICHGIKLNGKGCYKVFVYRKGDFVLKDAPNVYKKRKDINIGL